MYIFMVYYDLCKYAGTPVSLISHVTHRLYIKESQIVFAEVESWRLLETGIWIAVIIGKVVAT